MERIDKVQNLIPEKPEFVHSNQEKGEDVESTRRSQSVSWRIRKY